MMGIQSFSGGMRMPKEVATPPTLLTLVQRVLLATGSTDPQGIGVANQWQNIVCVFSGTSRKLYVNGTLEASQTGSTSSVTLNGKTIQIGKWSTSGNFHMNGLIDEVRVYDFAFADADAAAVYGGGAGDFGLPPTLTVDGGTTATNAPFTVTAEFLDGATAEAVTGFAADDITVAGGTLNNFIAVSGSKYTFDVVPLTVPSFVTVSVADAAGAVTSSSQTTGGTSATFDVQDQKKGSLLFRIRQ